MDRPLAGSVGIVTGASRSLGRAFAIDLAEAGAALMLVARSAHDLQGTADAVRSCGVSCEIVVGDVRDDALADETVRRTVDALGPPTVLINNAGIARDVDLLDGDLDGARAEMDTNYFGTLAMIRAFAPVIEANGGGAILNVLSVLSWISFPDSGGYCASKSAEWSMTNAVRAALHGRGIAVTGLHVGLMDTDMAAGFDAPKTAPADVARLAVDGIASGAYEVLADDVSRQVQAGLAGGVGALYPNLAG